MLSADLFKKKEKSYGYSRDAFLTLMCVNCLKCTIYSHVRRASACGDYTVSSLTAICLIYIVLTQHHDSVSEVAEFYSVNSMS